MNNYLENNLDIERKLKDYKLSYNIVISVIFIFISIVILIGIYYYYLNFILNDNDNKLNDNSKFELTEMNLDEITSVFRNSYKQSININVNSKQIIDLNYLPQPLLINIDNFSNLQNLTFLINENLNNDNNPLITFYSQSFINNNINKTTILWNKFIKGIHYVGDIIKTKYSNYYIFIKFKNGKQTEKTTFLKVINNYLYNPASIDYSKLYLENIDESNISIKIYPIIKKKKINVTLPQIEILNNINLDDLNNKTIFKFRNLSNVNFLNSNNINLKNIIIENCYNIDFDNIVCNNLKIKNIGNLNLKNLIIDDLLLKNIHKFNILNSNINYINIESFNNNIKISNTIINKISLPYNSNYNNILKIENSKLSLILINYFPLYTLKINNCTITEKTVPIIDNFESAISENYNIIVISSLNVQETKFGIIEFKNNIIEPLKDTKNINILLPKNNIINSKLIINNIKIKSVDINFFILNQENIKNISVNNITIY